MNDEGNVLLEDEFTGRPELVKKRARSILVQRLAIALVALYMIITTTIITLTSIEGIRARKILLDCTEPSGKCYQEGTKRTAKVVAGINAGTKDIVVIAAGCAKIYKETIDIEKCVNNELEKRNGPSPNR